MSKPNSRPLRILSQAQVVTQTLKALSHPVRLKLLCELCVGPRTVQELQTRCEIPQAMTSQFLAKLRSEGRVVGERDGNHVRYRIADDKLVTLVEALSQIYCSDSGRRKKGSVE